MVELIELDRISIQKLCGYIAYQLVQYSEQGIPHDVTEIIAEFRERMSLKLRRYNRISAPLEHRKLNRLLIGDLLPILEAYNYKNANLIVSNVIIFTRHVELKDHHLYNEYVQWEYQETNTFKFKNYFHLLFPKLFSKPVIPIKKRFISKL